MLGIGGFTPLNGFMTKADWQGVCDTMTMADGLFWPIPITLSTDAGSAEKIAIGSDVALVDSEDGSILATMQVSEKYAIDKAHECHHKTHIHQNHHSIEYFDDEVVENVEWTVV